MACLENLDSHLTAQAKQKAPDFPLFSCREWPWMPSPLWQESGNYFRAGAPSRRWGELVRVAALRRHSSHSVCS